MDAAGGIKANNYKNMLPIKLLRGAFTFAYIIPEALSPVASSVGAFCACDYLYFFEPDLLGAAGSASSQAA